MSKSYTLVKEFKLFGGGSTLVYPGIYEEAVDPLVPLLCSFKTSGSQTKILSETNEPILTYCLDGPHRNVAIFIGQGSTTTAIFDASSRAWSFEDFDGNQFHWSDGLLEMSWKLLDQFGNQVANFNALSTSRKIEGVLVLSTFVEKPLLMLIIATTKLILRTASGSK